MESLKIAASKILSNSWKQELNITENGVESEIFRTGTREKKNQRMAATLKLTNSQNIFPISSAFFTRYGLPSRMTIFSPEGISSGSACPVRRKYSFQRAAIIRGVDRQKRFSDQRNIPTAIV